MRPCLIAAALAAVLLAASSAAAQQQVNTQTPLHGVSHSFFERNGVGFSIRRPGFFLNVGGFNQAVPPFGGFQPGAGLQGGGGFAGGGFGGMFFFAAGQGSRTGNVMQSGSLTMMQGQSALLQDTSQTPFVIDLGRLPWKQQMDGVIPMQRPQAPTRTTTADEPAENPAAQPFRGGEGLSRLSVAEIRRKKAAARTAQQQKAQQNYDRGRAAEAKGKPAVARIYYRMAARDAEGDLKQQIEQRLQSLPD